MRNILLITLFLLTAAVFAETIDSPPFIPVTPRVMSQGGAFVSVAEGFESLFYNPAGFARTSFDLTILSETFWLYMNPALVQEFIETMPSEETAQEEGVDEGEQIMAFMNLINDQVANGGIGIGMSTGLGLMVKGIGVGCALMIDSYLEGNGGLMDVSGDIVATLGAVAGYAHTFEILGMKLSVGADLKPMYRIHSYITNREAMSMVSELFSGGDMNAALELISSSRALTGFGLGIDLGGILEIGPLQVGLSIRDLFGTKFKYYNNTTSAVLEVLETGGNIPQDEADLVTEDNYVIPMNISAGVALNIDVLKPLMELTVHGDLQDVIGVIKEKRSPWTLLHIGAEAKILEFIRARAGFNQGYITMGAGVHLLILDLNVGFFTRELGKYIGDQPNSGLTFELAFRI